MTSGAYVQNCPQLRAGRRPGFLERPGSFGETDPEPISASIVRFAVLAFSGIRLSLSALVTS